LNNQEFFKSLKRMSLRQNKGQNICKLILSSSISFMPTARF